MTKTKSKFAVKMNTDFQSISTTLVWTYLYFDLKQHEAQTLKQLLAIGSVHVKGNAWTDEMYTLNAM